VKEQIEMRAAKCFSIKPVIVVWLQRMAPEGCKQKRTDDAINRIVDVDGA
jgi:hypothetical protein